MQVKSVTKKQYEVPIPVYDLTVSGTENFCLANGVVVHNCADGVCGAYYLLLQRASTWQDGGRRHTSDRQGSADRSGATRADMKREESARQ